MDIVDDQVLTLFLPHLSLGQFHGIFLEKVSFFPKQPQSPNSKSRLYLSMDGLVCPHPRTLVGWQVLSPSQ